MSLYGAAPEGSMDTMNSESLLVDRPPHRASRRVPRCAETPASVVR
ncbi:hypothetical protein ACIHCV_42970 [Streptomyces sp. NPDC051956]